MTRRGFAAMTIGAGLAGPAIAQARARVVVIGGGAGGATVARYLGKDSKGLRVTLINAGASYTTCFFSNLYLSGFRSLRSLTHTYARLQDAHGVEVVIDRAVAIDRDARIVRLAGGGEVAYDRLVLSPGVSFRPNAIEGYDTAAWQVMPHAYTGGYQTYLLRRRLLAMRKGGVFVIAPPPNPYRCPPGPYERVSMIARLLSRTNPRSKVLVLDAKDSFAKQKLFQAGWDKYYPNMVEWTPASFTEGGVTRVDADARTVTLGSGETMKVDAACIIPPQRANELVIDAGLTDDGGWAPIDASTMRSTIDPNVYVLGDACRAGQMPKSGFAANSQAHVAALALRAELDGATLYPARYTNTCWSFISYRNVVKIGAAYSAQEGEIRATSTFVSQEDDAAAVRLDNAIEANGWYASMTADMFA